MLASKAPIGTSYKLILLANNLAELISVFPFSPRRAKQRLQAFAFFNMNILFRKTFSLDFVEAPYLLLR